MPVVAKRALKTVVCLSIGVSLVNLQLISVVKQVYAAIFYKSYTALQHYHKANHKAVSQLETQSELLMREKLVPHMHTHSIEFEIWHIGGYSMDT